MISLILPYWDRQEAADKAFATLEQYVGMDLEVVVVDDGNPVPFKVPKTGLDVRVVTLPAKTEPKSPVTCWNVGVREARGDVIALSCIEVLHDRAVLAGMLHELERSGPNAYVLAAAWCPEYQEWHTHSTVEVPECPPGTGIAFLGMLRKELYWAAGGFDEEYRDGAGYEDRDFIHRLTKAGARFIKRDDLTVTHPKAGASIVWGGKKFARNEALFRSKWPQNPLTFVCLKAGTAYGPEYVNILQDMVRRNMPPGIAWRFVCITDDAAGLSAGVETLPLPADLETWWGKIYMFKRGLFPDGARLVFMDLDTLIIGSLRELATYRGQFATLSDFYHPQRLGPAIIAWEAGDYAASIWEEWVSSGKPRDPMGDLWWLNELEQGRFAKRADKLQELFPGAFVSFKAHCRPYPPAGAKVVCFHGQPKPSNCAEDWVQQVWKVGGMMASGLEAVANTAQKAVTDRIKHSSSMPLPWLEIAPEHAGDAVLVGGGPSLQKTIWELRTRAARGAKVFAVNGAAAYLAKHDIGVDYHVIIDSRPENARFLTPDGRTHYLLASQCDKALFDIAGDRATLFHMNTAGVLDAIPPTDKPINLISTGTTVGLAAMGLAYCLGFRKIHLFGYDSSYEESHHAYPQPENDADAAVTVNAAGRTFKAAPWMVMQAQQFQEVARQLADAGCLITVSGDGLLPHIAHEIARLQLPNQEAA